MEKQIKKYIEINSLEIEQPNIGEDDLEQVKIDLVKFAEYFLKIFNNYTLAMKDCRDKKINEYSDKIEEIFKEVLKNYTELKNHTIEVGKTDIKYNLINCLYKHYFEINNFVAIFEDD